MARPSKYTPDRVDKICSYLQQGNARKTAAVLSGITEETFHSWLKRYPGFSELIRQAEEEAIANMVKVVVNDAIQKGNAKSAQWYLERKRPEDWGDKRRDLDGEVLFRVIEEDETDGISDKEAKTILGTASDTSEPE